MSQIAPDELTVDEGEERDPNAPARFAGALDTRPPLESSHAILTRTTWVRRTIEQALEGRAVTAQVQEDGTLALVLDEPLSRDILQYDLAPREEYSRFKLFSEDNGKMKCPTWDLVAGPPSIGGTCPAASAGQSVCDPTVRRTMLTSAKAAAPRGADQQPVQKGQLILTERMPTKDGGMVPVPFYEGDEPAPNQWRMPICQSCYASAGDYRGMNVAVGGVVRAHWTKYLIQHDPELWVRTIVTALKQLEYPAEGGGSDRILPMRVHSAGDFFSPDYARAWIEVANIMHAWDPHIVMWAPTRSWATPYWADTEKSGKAHWATLLDPDNLVSARKGKRLNFVVRASAYHVGDEAPGRLHPTNSVGTTSVFRDDNKTTAKKVDPRYDMDCPVYDRKRDAKSCVWAFDPLTKKLGCRVCWRNKDIRVNFTTH